MEHEKDGQFNILKGMFPKERIKKEGNHTNNMKNLIVTRFDPKQANCQNLIINEVEKKNKELKEKNSKKLTLESGIDKKRKNLMKAEAILKKKIHKNVNENENPVKKFKKIDYQAWKNLMQTPAEDDKPMTLFSK